MISKQVYSSPLGDILLLANDAALLGLYFVGQKYEAHGFEQKDMIEQTNAILDRTKSWLDAYFAGARPDLTDLVLAPNGTAFQKKVWQELTRIPLGETRTYGEIAKKINCSSARAVGGAVGRNPLSIIVPCHRVLGAAGQLTGYAGGIDKKIWLLEHEGFHFDKSFIPIKPV